MSEDVPGVAQKIITLRTIWAGADVFRIVAARPRTLMQPLQSIIANAQQVGLVWDSCATLHCAAVSHGGRP